MKQRNLSSFLLFLCVVFTSQAQYTNVINSNRPGKTETPYAVGTDVLQIEKSFSYQLFNQNNILTQQWNSNLNLRYGIWKEKFELSLTRDYNSLYQNKINYSKKGTNRLAVGVKYLVFDGERKETPEMFKSWKKRYGFWHQDIIPAIALALHYNTPFSNGNFVNANQSSATASLIAQNNIGRTLRINNQFDYMYIGAELPEFAYTISSTYVLNDKFNPFFEFAYHNNKEFSFFNFGLGSSYLINLNFLIAAYLDTTFGKTRNGVESGLHLSYRFDWHQDKWIKLESKSKKEQMIEDGELEEEDKSFFKRLSSTLFPKREKKEHDESSKLEEDTKKQEKNWFDNFLKKEKKEKKKKEQEEENKTNTNKPILGY
ncbi:transporter [Ochrovirga pacifica]|uniref:transporter n=1 Tax=Ochrovirga pacifica TaxID=1042376 RepID=UPI000255A4D7|nr:transporter [Ochrovirga pacifica]